ncbi:hypothetical protein ACE11G_10275 [Gordonia sp. PS3]|uniref:Tetratricopeptide repeat protein n=1 Tax=Gordonia sihwensis NBRC 108236 TaxID=1223544 RepID=L7LI90_9ACTN|nr:MULTISPECIES: hypothetical protein [Gordonia]AUH69249.1 hypothetical protein CXX93_14020 [Gordonia sp. YC-JH1]KXT57777.1 membrane protein [Gordonia sp. QH-12]GAC60835.1 hypothetical protein GSI01S_13_00180 [Gordonia sihwensis NBRC 108236]
MAAKKKADARPIVALIAFLVVALCVYFVLLSRTAIGLISDGGVVGIGLGVGVIVLPLLGVWMVVSTLRSGIEHQRMVAAAQDLGRDLDVDDLPRRPSGRIEKNAALELFEQVKVEWEADPSDWVSTYRIARAYDYAGDRSRAREMMRRAAEQYRAAKAEQRS